MVVGSDGTWFLAFNRTVRRPVILHPPHDPEFCNLLMASADEGRHWSTPRIVPSTGVHGVECPGLTATACGRLLLNQWRFHWHFRTKGDSATDPESEHGPGDLADSIAGKRDPAGREVPLELLQSVITWSRGGGDLQVHVSDDGGGTFSGSGTISTAPFCGGYGMRGAIELRDRSLLLPLSDAPRYQAVFHVRSRDRGETWSASSLVAKEPDKEFEEPAGLLLDNGQVLLLLRENQSQLLHRVLSDDFGHTWERPVATGIPDFPADLLDLGDGRIACVAGRRVKPFGIVMYLSGDGGLSWNVDRPIAVREDLPNPDLGYPTIAQRRNGELVVVYYGQDQSGITGLYSTTLDPRSVT